MLNFWTGLTILIKVANEIFFLSKLTINKLNLDLEANKHWGSILNLYILSCFRYLHLDMDLFAFELYMKFEANYNNASFVWNNKEHLFHNAKFAENFKNQIYLQSRILLRCELITLDFLWLFMLFFIRCITSRIVYAYFDVWINKNLISLYQHK